MSDVEEITDVIISIATRMEAFETGLAALVVSLEEERAIPKGSVPTLLRHSSESASPELSGALLRLAESLEG